MTSFRYSLRTLLVAMAILPALAYWLTLPTLRARRYAAALAVRDYDEAERLCLDQQNPHPGEAKDWLSFSASARIERLTWQDILRGRRRMTYFFAAHVGSAVMSFSGQECFATRQGIAFRTEDQVRHDSP